MNELGSQAEGKHCSAFRPGVRHASFPHELAEPRTDGLTSLPLVLASSATSSNQGFRRHGRWRFWADQPRWALVCENKLPAFGVVSRHLSPGQPQAEQGSVGIFNAGLFDDKEVVIERGPDHAFVSGYIPRAFVGLPPSRNIFFCMERPLKPMLWLQSR